MKLKRGVIRKDGMVFWAYEKLSRGGEWWVSMEKFNEMKERCRVNGKKWKEKNPERVQSWGLKKRYGITPQIYKNILISQNGCCAICGKESCSTGDNFSVDHCHKTGNIRGLLCRKCNVGIGQLSDSPILLRKAAEYLEHFNQD